MHVAFGWQVFSSGVVHSSTSAAMKKKSWTCAKLSSFNDFLLKRLGVAKHLLKIWFKKSIVSKNFQQIDYESNNISISAYHCNRCRYPSIRLYKRKCKILPCRCSPRWRHKDSIPRIRWCLIKIRINLLKLFLQLPKFFFELVKFCYWHLNWLQK